MKVVDVNVKVRCDIPNCKETAKYKIIKTGFLKNAGLMICKDCMMEMYTTLGEHIVPKSPSNMLNRKITNKKLKEDVNENF
jgi:hypothetical protein